MVKKENKGTKDISEKFKDLPDEIGYCDIIGGYE